MCLWRLISITIDLHFPFSRLFSIIFVLSVLSEWLIELHTFRFIIWCRVLFRNSIHLSCNLIECSWHVIVTLFVIVFLFDLYQFFLSHSLSLTCRWERAHSPFPFEYIFLSAFLRINANSFLMLSQINIICHIFMSYRAIDVRHNIRMELVVHIGWPV